MIGKSAPRKRATGPVSGRAITLSYFRLSCASAQGCADQSREQAMGAIDLATYPIHLGLGGAAVIEPAFTGGEWYEAYGARHAADGAEGRLVSLFTFKEPWPTWEMHPKGCEVVLCVSGAMVLHQEHPDGTRTEVSLEAGQYAINPPGVWHTADIAESASGVFITSGDGTQIRPR
jgi:hypothetical protein